MFLGFWVSGCGCPFNASATCDNQHCAFRPAPLSPCGEAKTPTWRGAAGRGAQRRAATEQVAIYGANLELWNVREHRGRQDSSL